MSRATRYETIYARVPKPTKQKIESIRKKNGYPSVSQTINAIVENAGNNEAVLDEVVKALAEIKESSNKPLRDLTLAELFDALQKRSKTKK